MRPWLWCTLLLAGCGPDLATAPPPTDVDRVETTLIGESARSRREELRITGVDGKVYEFYQRAPRAASRPVPAVFILAGFETGKAALDLIDERDDLVLMSMDYPFAGSKSLGGLGVLRALPRLRRMGFDTLEAGSVALDYLAQARVVDHERIILLGVSFGSVFITALGGRDQRARAVVLIYGGGQLDSVVRRALRRRTRWMLSWLAPPVTWLFFDEFEPLDHVARIAPRYLLMISSRHDELFPPDTATALYERAREPKKLIWYDTGHMDLFEPALIRRLAREVVTELRAAGHLP
jgi:fermentation-respiration switch protein FrsA (DUF1100 family)